MPHLFVDISAHGFGHLAQVAPVLDALAGLLPGLQLTLRSGLPRQRLQARIAADFRHLEAASDFGYVMVDALRIDHAANALAYRDFHAGWPARVAAEAALLRGLAPDFVLSDVAYLPLAAAAGLGLPAAAMSSLNWADLFAHFYGRESWAGAILGEIRAAYAAADFLLLTPGMAMAWHPRVWNCQPVAALGRCRRAALREHLRLPARTKLVIVALGGIPARLPVEGWLQRRDVVWLLPAAWQIGHCRCREIESTIDSLGWNFPDLLASVDALLTKPGYGSFTEAACNGVPTLYLRRDDWPEQEVLIAWLEAVAVARELPPDALAGTAVGDCLDALWTPPARLPRPQPGGADEVAAWLATRLVRA